MPGLDPLLRARIWEYLRSLAKTGVTVIVTTHYIDEAREADRVGLMRHGRYEILECIAIDHCKLRIQHISQLEYSILVEDAPNVLLRRFGYDSLEDVFLKICRDISKKPKSHQPGELFSPSVTPEISSTHSHVAGAGGRLINSADYEFDHEKGNGNGIHHRGASKSANDDLEASEAMRPLGKPKAAMRPPSILRRPKQVLGTTRRKFTQIIRNWKLLAWEILVPTIQICAFMLAVGADPKNLPLVVRTMGSCTLFSSVGQILTRFVRITGGKPRSGIDWLSFH
jgi:energy-coupling factor transporter ATP-binding protein EcfA2